MYYKNWVDIGFYSVAYDCGVGWLMRKAPGELIGTAGAY